MFNKNKINHKVVVTCSNENHTATYSFIESYDENWCDKAEKLFYEEFGEYPKESYGDSYERV